MYTFPRKARLTRRTEFDFVFTAPDKRSHDRYFTVLGRSRPQDVNRAVRLGMVVAKKRILKANERNRVKRQIRESFRCQDFSCVYLDIVVLPKSLAVCADNGELAHSLDSHWYRICRR